MTMKKITLLLAACAFTFAVSAQDVVKENKTTLKSTGVTVKGNERGTGHSVLVPATMNLKGSTPKAYVCGDSLDTYTFTQTSAPGKTFLNVGAPYVARVGQKFTAPMNCTIDSAEVFYLAYSRQNLAIPTGTQVPYSYVALYPDSTAAHKPVVCRAAVALGYSDSIHARTMNKLAGGNLHYGSAIFNFHQTHLGSNPNGVALTAGKVFYASFINPNPTYGDSLTVLNTPYANECYTQTDSTSWVYIYNGTRYWWASDMHYWNGPKANTKTAEFAIVLYYSYDNTGVAENNTAAKVSVYPNPANDVLNVNNIGKDAKVIMVNSLGQVVYNTTASEKLTINTSEMKEGFYFVKVNENVFKVVVTK